MSGSEKSVIASERLAGRCIPLVSGIWVTLLRRLGRKAVGTRSEVRVATPLLGDRPVPEEGMPHGSAVTTVRGQPDGPCGTNDRRHPTLTQGGNYMRLITKRKITVLAALLIAAIAAIGGYAYFTANGSGSGTATVGTSSNIVLHGSTVGTLYPGTSVSISFTADN